MQVVFYGTARGVGTSANMAACAAGLLHFFQIPVKIRSWEEPEKSQKGQVSFLDCAGQKETGGIIQSCDLLALNLSLPCRGLEEAYLKHFLVRKNVIFLVGKYYQNRLLELKQLAAWFRIPSQRIGVIPYHPGFREAYENKEILRYLKNPKGKRKSSRDYEFEKCIECAAKAVITYGNRKGELFYG